MHERKRSDADEYGIEQATVGGVIANRYGQGQHLQCRVCECDVKSTDPTQVLSDQIVGVVPDKPRQIQILMDPGRPRHGRGSPVHFRNLLLVQFMSEPTAANLATDSIQTECIHSHNKSNI